MKTLAELEAESTDGFKNPEVSDDELAETLKRNKIKSEAENVPSRIQLEPDEEDDNTDDND